METGRKKVLAKIAYQYYIHGNSQSEIARELNVDRTTISRMLKEAREAKVVSIAIDGYDQKVMELEAYLKERFRLKNIIISHSPEEKSCAKRNELLYQDAADYIQRIIKNGDNIGLTWGKTIAKVVEKTGTRQLNQASFFPLAGGPSSSNIDYHVNTIVYDIARKLGGTGTFINEKVVQNTRQEKDRLVAADSFQSLNRYWDNLDISIVGIGGSLKQRSIWRDVLCPADYEELKLREAVGDCCCQFFDRDGKILKGKLYDRTISIPLEKLRKVNYSVGIAANKNKARAILSMLKKRYINVLITDYETALLITELAKREG